MTGALAWGRAALRDALRLLGLTEHCVCVWGGAALSALVSDPRLQPGSCHCCIATAVSA